MIRDFAAAWSGRSPQWWRLLDRAGIIEHLHPCAHVMTVVVPGTAADQVAVDDAGLVDEGAAADLEVELAFRHGGHTASAHAIGSRRNLDAMADAGDRLVFGEKVPGDPDQICIVADILGGATAAEENAEIILLVYVGEGDIGVDGVAFPFLGDGPARLHLVQHHLVL